jgi:hypothetical protein
MVDPTAGSRRVSDPESAAIQAEDIAFVAGASPTKSILRSPQQQRRQRCGRREQQPHALDVRHGLAAARCCPIVAPHFASDSAHIFHAFGDRAHRSQHECEFFFRGPMGQRNGLSAVGQLG